VFDKSGFVFDFVVINKADVNMGKICGFSWARPFYSYKSLYYRYLDYIDSESRIHGELNGAR